MPHKFFSSNAIRERPSIYSIIYLVLKCYTSTLMTSCSFNFIFCSNQPSRICIIVQISKTKEQICFQGYSGFELKFFLVWIMWETVWHDVEKPSFLNKDAYIWTLIASFLLDHDKLFPSLNFGFLCDKMEVIKLIISKEHCRN